MLFMHLQGTKITIDLRSIIGLITWRGRYHNIWPHV